MHFRQLSGSGLLGQALGLGIGRGIAMLLSFIGFLLVARLLGPQQFGGFIFAFSLASLLVFLPNMGVDPYYSREVPAGRATATRRRVDPGESRW